MNRRLLRIVAAGVLTAAFMLAHDASKHKGKPVQGEVVSIADDRFEVKTDAGVVPVKTSAKTKFEHGSATVDRTHVSKGARVSVFGTKLPSGEIVAREVLIGGSSDHGQHAPTQKAGAPKTTKSSQH